MNNIKDLQVKIFADGANIKDIKELSKNPLIKGFTTNPTLMRNAGVDNYESFAKEVLEVITDRPVSFEVFSDDIEGMEKQAMKIASWANNVNVKIPITNTKGDSTVPLVGRLSDAGVAVNVTAMMTLEQVTSISNVLNEGVSAIVSVFAGRIADTGLDPVPLMSEAAEILKNKPKADLLWASPRELLNIFHADQCGCGIITVTPDVLAKLKGVGKDLNQFSLETVQMFFNDASSAGYTINTD
jgi:transaldolase